MEYECHSWMFLEKKENVLSVVRFETKRLIFRQIPVGQHILTAAWRIPLILLVDLHFSILKLYSGTRFVCRYRVWFQQKNSTFCRKMSLRTYAEVCNNWPKIIVTTRLESSLFNIVFTLIFLQLCSANLWCKLLHPLYFYTTCLRCM